MQGHAEPFSDVKNLAWHHSCGLHLIHGLDPEALKPCVTRRSGDSAVKAGKPRSKALHEKPVSHLLVPLSLLPALCRSAPLLGLLCLPPQLRILLYSPSPMLACLQSNGPRVYTLACGHMRTRKLWVLLAPGRRTTKMFQAIV